MANPTYRGARPNAGNGGLLARLGSIFTGSGTPPYRGDRQPVSGAGGFFSTATPRYKNSAKARLDSNGVTCTDVMPEIIPIDRDELAAGKIAVISLDDGRIAIVVPRDVCGSHETALDDENAGDAQQQQQ